MTLMLSLLGRNSALYENGWFERDIMYLNTNLLEYRVNFSDGSFDYIDVEDINGVDIELL